MSDVLLLAGMALCALSVLMAVISVLRMQAPRGAAITLILGILLMFGGAKLSPEPFGVTSLTGAGQRLIDGQIRLGGNPASAGCRMPRNAWNAGSIGMIWYFTPSARASASASAVLMSAV